MQPGFCKDNCFSRNCLNRLVSLVRKNSGRANSKLIENAFLFSKGLHKGQFRASKHPYFLHPLETAAILAELDLSSEVVAAALLHDVLEDTEAKGPDLRKRFGKEVFSLVDGVTKLDLLASESRDQNALQNLHSLLFATTRDPRVILIKLADKLHNLRTLQYLPARDRKRIADEALLIYVPIAHKVGLLQLARELEDLAFKHAKPETFKRLQKQFGPACCLKEREIDLAIAILRKRLERASFYRERRSVYSVFTKMRNTNKILEELNDCVILNVLVESRKDCYLALGVVHSLFPPLPNKVKDFVATPKPSLFRVLQTTVFGPKEKPIKIRIATSEMDTVNNRGIVAYRKLHDERLPAYIRQSLSELGLLLNNGRAKGRFINAMKLDFLTRPIFVFSAKGRLVELPKKSTVLDFAFAAVGKRALRLLKAKVDGKRASFGKVLNSGQVIELFFSKKPRVKRDWLLYAQGFLAREAIGKAIKTKD